MLNRRSLAAALRPLAALGVAIAILSGCGAVAAVRGAVPDPLTMSIADVERAFHAGSWSPERLVTFYLDRIERHNGKHRAVMPWSVYGTTEATNRRDVLSQAADSSRRIRSGTARRLEGIPILLKDNIGMRSMPATGGSLALRGLADQDAEIVQRLRGAGAIILGKNNLSEWACLGCNQSGVSGVGGTTINAYPGRTDPGGSSSGSGVSTALGLAQFSIGSETMGSIMEPSFENSVWGFKPTVGLVPGGGIVPLSTMMDTVGPIARNPADLAEAASVLAGTELARAQQTQPRRILVLSPNQPRTVAMNDALENTRGLDIQIIGAPDINLGGSETIFDRQRFWQLMMCQASDDIAAYLQARNSPVRNLAQLNRFNETTPGEQMADGKLITTLSDSYLPDGTPVLDKKQPCRPKFDPEFLQLKAQASKYLDGLMAARNADAIAVPSETWSTGTGTPVDSITTVATYAQHPLLQIPLPAAGSVPSGITLIGRSRGDATVLDIARTLATTLPQPSPAT